MWHRALLRRSGPALACLSVAALDQKRREVAEACGIVGVVGRENDDARGFLLEGLMVLRNRGYDSAGIATLEPSSGEVTVSKYASVGSTADCIDLLRSKTSHHTGHHVGIAHTRWATHGGKTDENAHPHTDAKNRIALVHNGVINNANKLRQELQATGIKFTSETDTEVIAKLIGWYLDNGATTVKEATSKALSRCDGTWGIAVMSHSPDDDEVVVACNGSPMTIGLGQGKTFIASEPAAFNKYTKNFIAMQDGEIGVVAAHGTSLDLGRVEKAPELDIRDSPDPFPHWTLRECLEQPEALARALGFGGRLSEDRVYLGGLDRQRERMAKISTMILAGCGTSLNASIYGAKLMREYEAFDTAMSMDAAEIRPADIPSRHAGMLAVSQSGETKDVHRAVVAAESMGLPCISVVNAVGSLIARTTKLGVYCNAGRENAVASTKAFTTQVTVLALLTCWFRQLRDENPATARMGRPDTLELLEALQRLPISFGMANRVRPKVKEVAARLKDKEHLFILGKGYGEPIAYEGALKIKECAYIHAEGYSGGALKHGPFALIEGPEGQFGATPIICLVLDDEYAMQMRTVAEEVKARHAEVIIITDNPKLAEGLDPSPIVIPRNGPLTALTAVLPLQLLAYELALLRGVNPDVPRNLAKAVTVD
eukprot:CAMPEP_0119468558 /NCGR_PEP_ID=MMETSP1344-20130328/2258_1 /TAXON_ID=236787 /ORGANISM="Florenciella parvula, Strain CCMP2471" /LENGTH=656 /DNA_ID=CAMNT_0007501039 /DNA_START=11 /DNA_END=1981 /DNA_ORIENTATION=-